MRTTDEPIDYIPGMGRNPGEEYNVSHLYAKFSDGSMLPMCRRGWNRSDGEGFSIFRGRVSLKGICKTCQRNVNAGKSPVDCKPGSHKTKWI